jgi:hypothetical protein
MEQWVFIVIYNWESNLGNLQSNGASHGASHTCDGQRAIEGDTDPLERCVGWQALTSNIQLINTIIEINKI